MSFDQPFGFWLALAGLGVLLAHVVRRRARRRTVPFLPLWTALLAQRRGGLGSALVRRLDLLLVLLVCAAVALAAGAPYLPGTPDTVRDLVLVLDGGVALHAGTRLPRLRQVAAAEINRRADGARLVVVRVTDDGADVWSGGSKEDALAVVSTHRAGWTVAPRGQALELARTAAAPLRDADVVLCTHRAGEAPPGVRLRTVVETIANVGVATLAVGHDPEGTGAIASIGLRGHGEVEVGELWRGRVDGARDVVVPLRGAGPIALHVRAADDGFAPDDRAFLVLPERRAPRVLVVAAGEPSPFLATALGVLESMDAIEGPLDRTTPDRAAAAAEAYDICVFDRCAPTTRVTKPALYLAPPPGALPFRVGADTPSPAIFDLARDEPLLQGFDLARVVPMRARAVLGGRPLARAAPGPVLAAGPGWIALGFDPDRCILAASPAYPLFLRNALALLAGNARRAEPEFYAVGEASDRTGVAEVEGAGPVAVERRLVGPPGFWRFGEDDVIAVNLLLPDLDLRPAPPGDPLPDVGLPGRPRRPLTALFAAAAVVLLLLAWWIFWR